MGAAGGRAAQKGGRKGRALSGSTQPSACPIHQGAGWAATGLAHTGRNSRCLCDLQGAQAQWHLDWVAKERGGAQCNQTPPRPGRDLQTPGVRGDLEVVNSNPLSELPQDPAPGHSLPEHLQ